MTVCERESWSPFVSTSQGPIHLNSYHVEPLLCVPPHFHVEVSHLGPSLNWKPAHTCRTPSTCASAFSCGRPSLNWKPVYTTTSFYASFHSRVPKRLQCTDFQCALVGCPICIIHFLKSFGVSCQLNFTSSFSKSKCTELPAFAITPNEGNKPLY